MTLEDLESRLWYSPEKGEWRRFAVKGGNTISSIAGYKHRTGYIYIGVCSRYKGVSIHRETGKFRARIFLGRRVSKSLGLYATAHEASLAYEKAAKELFGMFARVH
jgi:hypothetical protein